MQLAVRDCMVAADAFAEVVGAEKVREDELRVFNAKRTVVQAGESEFELLEPAGDGAVASHLERWGEGIFAAGFSTDNPGALARRMDDRALRFREEGGQIFIEPDQTRHDAQQRLLSGGIVVVYANGPTLQVAKGPDLLFPEDLEAPEMQTAQDRDRRAGIHPHYEIWRKAPAEIHLAAPDHIGNCIRVGRIGLT